MTTLSDELRTFMVNLLDAPGPSGFEEPAATVWRDYASQFADVRTDDVGNSFATVNAGASTRIAIFGHIDEIGLIVTKIDADGFIRFSLIGGWDTALLLGQRVRIATANGIVYGTIGRGAIHHLTGTEKTSLPDVSDMWIDIAATDHADAARQVDIGDPIVVDVSPRFMGDHRIVARALDNRLGCYMAVEVARACAGIDVEVTAVAASREEVGGFGAVPAAASLQPDRALVVEVTGSADTPAGNPVQWVHLGDGPLITRGASVSDTIAGELAQTATEQGIAFQKRGMGIRTRTDADRIVSAGTGVPLGLINVGARYLHSPCEQADLRDVADAVSLMSAWVKAQATVAVG